METQQLHQIGKLVNILFRRKALISLSLIFALAAGLGVYLKQPKVYQSNALLSYQQQGLNPTKMSPDIDARVKDIVSTLTQIVTSRSNLERIITQEGLYPEERARLPMEDVVIMMRKDISIVPSREGDTFRVGFSGRDPNQVTRVTNALAARFIEENLKYREERASDTSAYTEDELRMAKETLDTREEIMRDFKLKHYNEMPDQQASNVSRLIALQTQHQNRQASIQDLERTRLLLQEQLTVRKQLMETAMVQATPDGRAPLMETDQQRLARLQAELESLRGRYTEQHPQVITLQRRIARIAASLAQEASAGQPSATEAKADGPGAFDSGLFDLELQLRSLTMSIAKLNQEKDAIQVQIDQLEEWVANAPTREAEWTSLTREYGELKRHYDFLVSQNLQARSALNLERNQRGSQFKIEDPALLPSKPVKPDFAKIIKFALLAGLGLGGGLAFALEMFDTSFRSPRDLEESVKEQFSLEMICAIPHFPLKGEVIRQRLLSTLGTLVILGMAATLAGAFYYFYDIGKILL